NINPERFCAQFCGWLATKLTCRFRPRAGRPGCGIVVARTARQSRGLHGRAHAGRPRRTRPGGRVSPTSGATASALSPFQNRVFRDVWVANLVSQFGGLIQVVGASWLMLSLAESAEMVALVQSSTTLPIVIFALVAGALADSFDRRAIMIASQVFMLVVSVVLAACAYLDLITPWLL